jgi:hypothetical protein
MFAPTPSPRYLPVNVPLPEYDSHITIVTVERNGNVTIKTEQNKPEGPAPYAT